MSVVSVRARSFILALFIRDDGERFLLGDRGFDFKDSQLHFSANTIENDEVAKQGIDGVMLAGQVRRASVQSFDGYVGDATTLKEEVEQMRRDFIAFFAKGHHFRVIYIDCNRNAWQRKGGYLVDAPEVKELWQIHPEYHVGLNFEDVNYYEYDENADGQEILANIMKLPISSDVEGGLVWDENGAVSEPAEIEYDTETATASGTNISIADAVEAPLKSLEIQGETSQQTYTGKNLFVLSDPQTKSGITLSKNTDGTINLHGTSTSSSEILFTTFAPINFFENGATYTLSCTKTLSAGLSVRAEIYDNTTWLRSFVSTSRTTAAINTTSGNRVRLSISVSQGATINIDNLGIQLEKASQATAFEPYVGGVPAPNPDYPQAVQTVTGENTITISDGTNTQSYEVNLGKNLYDKSASTDGYRLNTSGAPYADYAFTLSDYIPVKPNTTYTISYGSAIPSYAHIASYGSDKTFVYRWYIEAVSSRTFTTQENAYYIRLAIPIDYKNTTQLEKGSTATSYAAYFTPIELCKIGTYQDYIYKSGDKWYVHKEVGEYTFTGNESPSINTTSTNTTRCLINNCLPADAPAQPQATGTGKSNYFGYRTNWSDDVAGIYSNNRTIVFRGAKTTIGTTQDAVKAWLASTNPMCYYALATPTDTEITNEALVAQLEAILAGGTYAGTNNITTVISAGNAQGELEITYYTKYDVKVVGGGYVWEAGGSGGPTIVTNESISAVSPVWTVFGPALNPMLENTTTGEQIQYVGMISEGQTLVVDMGEQTASLDGLNVISNIVGEYLTLAPGSNTLLFSADSDAPASEIGWSEIVG